MTISKLTRRLAAFAALFVLVIAMGGRWMTPRAASAAPTVAAAQPVTKPAATVDRSDDHAVKPVKKDLTGKININTATEEQLMMLPTVGPSKAERIVVWRKKNGGFKRVADLRRVKGFGYRTFKRLEPLLDIKGDTSLAAKH